MLYVSFHDFTKIQLYYNLIVCIHCDLDLDRTMSIIALVRDMLIYYTVLKFHVPRLIQLELSCKTHTHTHQHTHTKHTRFEKTQL